MDRPGAPPLPPPPIPLTPPVGTRASLRSIGADAPAPPVPDDEDPRAAHILVARYRKSKKLSSALLAMGGDAAKVAELGRTELGRTLAADRAGTHVPSEVCWALVVEMVREVRP